MMKCSLAHSERHESGHRGQEPLWRPLVALADGHAVDDSGSVTPVDDWGGDTRMEGVGPCESILSNRSLLFHFSDSF